MSNAQQAHHLPLYCCRRVAGASATLQEYTMANSTQNTETAASDTPDASKKSGRTGAPRGFAAMDPAQQRRIASEGGRAAHASGNAHEFTSEEARAAGSKSRGGKGAKSGQPASGSGTAQ
jgi:general stress protein YciG